jgi:hypothetical protein
MTRKTDLSELETRIAGASPADEAALLIAASELLLSGETTRKMFDTFREARAYSDAAMLIYRTALPRHGFQFGLPPPLPNGRPASAVATSWQRGNSVSIPYRAETPALALLRAAAGEFARRLAADELSECTICRGLGWFVTSQDRRQICRHGND